MADIFWEGFDKYGPVNSTPANTTMNSEWTTVPSSSESAFVAGRFANSLALQLQYQFTSASRTLTSNYSRLIGGVALNCSLSNNSGVIFGDAGTNQCAVGINTAGKIVLWNGSLGGTQIAISSTAVTANTWHYLEWDLSFSSTGSYNVYLDGVSVFSGTGNLKSSSNAYANQIILIGATCNYDDMYLFDSTGSVNNAVRGDSRVETLFPTADASVQFTPSAGAFGAYYSLTSGTTFMSSGLYLRKFTATTSGNINSISVMSGSASSSANFKPALYADNAGSPGTLLKTGSQVTGCTANVAVTMPLSSAQAITAGTNYWIGYVTDTSLTMIRQDSSSFATNAGYTASVTYSSAPPSTAPSMSSGNTSLQVWGNMTGMTTNFSETNEVPPGGDLICVASATVGAEDLYNFNSLSTTPSNIAGVKVSALLRKTDTGPRTITVQLKSGSTEVTGAAQAPPASYAYFSNYLDTDPATSAAWTATGVNSILAGTKIAS